MPNLFDVLDQKAQDQDISFEELLGSCSPAEIQELQDTVMNWTEESFKETHRVLAKYYRIQVPVELLKQVLIKNLDLAHEVYSDSVGDTFARSGLAYCILKEVGITKEWPGFSDKEEYLQEFHLELLTKAVPKGIVLLC